MIRSIFTRDKPGTSDPAVGEALADVELAFGDSVPTGTYLDMTANLPVVDPQKVHAPVMIVRGEFDGIATEEDRSISIGSSGIRTGSSWLCPAQRIPFRWAQIASNSGT
jgi:hypothetical protein